jgi:tetratricopeptide (TPR) repeat protein
MAETLSARELIIEGQSAYKAKRYREAAASFEQAARALQSSGDSQSAAEAANNSSVAFLQAGSAADALRLAKGTPAVFATAGDFRRQGMALANQAAALEGLHRLPEALETYQQASDLLKQAGENDLRALVLENISTLQLRTGNQLQALASMDTALEHKGKLTIRERLLKKLLRVPFDMLNRK